MLNIKFVQQIGSFIFRSMKCIKNPQFKVNPVIIPTFRVESLVTYADHRVTRIRKKAAISNNNILSKAFIVIG